jgi:hypothetical protein
MLGDELLGPAGRLGAGWGALAREGAGRAKEEGPDSKARPLSLLAAHSRHGPVIVMYAPVKPLKVSV